LLAVVAVVGHTLVVVVLVVIGHLSVVRTLVVGHRLNHLFSFLLQQPIRWLLVLEALVVHQQAHLEPKALIPYSVQLLLLVEDLVTVTTPILLMVGRGGLVVAVVVALLPLVMVVLVRAIRVMQVEMLQATVLLVMAVAVVVHLRWVQMRLVDWILVLLVTVALVFLRASLVPLWLVLAVVAVESGVLEPLVQVVLVAVELVDILQQRALLLLAQRTRVVVVEVEEMVDMRLVVLVVLVS
jgi:hypothetical protein